MKEESPKSVLQLDYGDESDDGSRATLRFLAAVVLAITAMDFYSIGSTILNWSVFSSSQGPSAATGLLYSLDVLAIVGDGIGIVGAFFCLVNPSRTTLSIRVWAWIMLAHSTIQVPVYIVWQTMQIHKAGRILNWREIQAIWFFTPYWAARAGAIPLLALLLLRRLRIIRPLSQRGNSAINTPQER